MNKRLELMRSGNIKQALLSLGLPTIIGLLTIGIYNFVDSYFVSQLGTEAMGAISITYPLITLIPGIALLFGNGGSAFISRLLGSRDYNQAEIVLSSTIAYSLLFAILAQLSLFFLPEILTFLGASENILPLAIEYTEILIISFLFHIPSVALMNLVRAEGAIALSTASQLAGSIINIFLDPLFIFTFGMGIRGAAIATAIAQFISFSMLISYYIFNKSILKFSFKKVKIHKWILIPIFNIGIPLFAINLFQSVSLTVANRFAANYGDTTVAALGIVNRVIGISTFVITGFSRGYQTFISYNYGANNMDRVREATRISLIWGILGGIVLSLIQVGFSSNIINAFSDSPVVIGKSMQAMFAGSIFFFTYGFQAIAVVYLLSIGFNRSGFIFSIARQGLIFIPTIILMNSLLGEAGVFYAQGITDILTTIFLILFLFYVSRNQKLKSSS